MTSPARSGYVSIKLAWWICRSWCTESVWNTFEVSPYAGLSPQELLQKHPIPCRCQLPQFCPHVSVKHSAASKKVHVESTFYCSKMLKIGPHLPFAGDSNYSFSPLWNWKMVPNWPATPCHWVMCFIEQGIPKTMGFNIVCFRIRVQGSFHKWGYPIAGWFIEKYL